MFLNYLVSYFSVSTCFIFFLGKGRCLPSEGTRRHSITKRRSAGRRGEQCKVEWSENVNSMEAQMMAVTQNMNVTAREGSASQLMVGSESCECGEG